MRKSYSLVLAAMCVTAAILAGCQSASTEDTWTIKRGDALPAFQLKTADGKPFTSADLSGKVGVIALWASWCPPCRMELPVLDEKIHHALKDKGVVVVGVNVGEDASTVAAYSKESKLKFPLLTDPESSFSSTVGGQFLPRSLIVDRRGKIRNLHAGFNPAEVDELVAEVEKLAAEK
ncbi:MAG: TlpA family protein disulfide reductase [Candidatus Sumerlaeaceae bacterium]